MDVQITRRFLKYQELEVQAFLFIPKKAPLPYKHAAIFTHGYTSHKAVLVPWASKLVEQNIPALIFDLPGHFLGSFSDIDSLETFKTKTPYLFESARKLINQEANQDIPFYFVGGHSLGALMSILSLDKINLSNENKMAIGVGFGAPPQKVTHIFDTPFFRKTMETRSQLVSSKLAPEIILPWIRDQKNAHIIKNQKIHLISGQDDVIVGKDGVTRLIEHLKNNNNQISFELPKSLPHHLPENGSTHVNHFIRNFVKENS